MVGPIHRDSEIGVLKLQQAYIHHSKLSVIF
jgi:hypothetical protein